MSTAAACGQTGPLEAGRQGRSDEGGADSPAAAQSKNGKRRRRRQRAMSRAKGEAVAGGIGKGQRAAGVPGGGPAEANGPGGEADGAARLKPRRKRRRLRKAKRALTAAAAGEPRPPSASVADGNAEAGVVGGSAAPRRERADTGNATSVQPPPLYAALDLGTNNCRLLVATPTRPGQFRVVDAFSRIVRLGEGLAASGRLSDAAMERAVDALKVCAAKLADRPIRKTRLIATEACRAASNGAEFLERVTRETGLKLEVVDRETEARLAVSGCASLVERETDSVVLFDIGGGSSEIAVIELPPKRSPRLANHIRAWTSLPVGVVTLSERFGGRDVTRETFAAMVADVDAMLEAFLSPQLPGMDGSGGRFHLIGTSGTVTTLAGVYLNLPRYDRRRVDGLWLTSDDVDAMLDKILSWDFHERSANPCIGADRADLVLAGCAILEGIRNRWPSERMRVADRGLREGLLTEMMAADGVWRRRRGRFPGTDRGRPAPRPSRPRSDP